ncbi:unnamed protein product [Meloidogyne enterolobii]|uniref:Uncharacterized protein n=1 Tax=Meloidogyne enterolobii TaxID=390850 RepID=A0ACB0XU56_MELEN
MFHSFCQIIHSMCHIHFQPKSIFSIIICCFHFLLFIFSIFFSFHFLPKSLRIAKASLRHPVLPVEWNHAGSILSNIPRHYYHYIP